MQRITVLTSIFLHVVGGNSFKYDSRLDILSNNVSFFKEINSQLDSITRELFSCLKLDYNYTKSTKMKMLTFIHHSLRNVSEEHFKDYNDITNISKVTFNVTPDTALFELTNVIEDLFKNLSFNAYAVVDVFEKEFNNTEALFKSFKFINHYNTSEGIVEMIKYFIERKDSNILQPISPKDELKRMPLKVTSLNRLFRRVNRPLRKPVHKLRLWRPTNESSELSSSNRRIYKGTKVPIHRYSFMVSIHIMGEFTCSGSIISRDLIITSASCLQIVYNNPNLLKTQQDVIKIRAGTESTRKGGMVAPAQEIHFHPKYDPVYLEHNLALARLKMTLILRSSDIKKMKRIEYDTKKTKLSRKKPITILGWGDKDNYSRYVGPLTKAQLDVYNQKTCKQIYTEKYVHDTNFCAGFVDVGGGACKRDLGGPALVDKVLVGIVNFGPPVCGTPDAPTVFTRLSSYSDWIDSVVMKVIRSAPAMTMPRTFKFRQSNDKPDSKEKKIDKSKEELTILKTLFKKYVQSGKVNVTDLIVEKKKPDVMKLTFFDDDSSRHFEVFSTPKVLATASAKNPSLLILPFQTNQTSVSNINDKSKFNSLTDNDPNYIKKENEDKVGDALRIDAKPTNDNNKTLTQEKFLLTAAKNTENNLYQWEDSLPLVQSKEAMLQRISALLQNFNPPRITPLSTMPSPAHSTIIASTTETLVVTTKKKPETTFNSKLRMHFDSYNEESSTELEKELEEKDPSTISQKDYHTIKYLF